MKERSVRRRAATEESFQLKTQADDAKTSSGALHRLASKRFSATGICRGNSKI
jgi:hypothetical protein